jgi:hypothetical protein
MLHVQYLFSICQAFLVKPMSRERPAEHRRTPCQRNGRSHLRQQQFVELRILLIVEMSKFTKETKIINIGHLPVD